MSKPIVYIASPYTAGDPALNVRFQCEVFDHLLTHGRCVPIAPLWCHFQHVLFPRPYEDWIAHDLELVRVCDACVRLEAVCERVGYREGRSPGADGEVDRFRAMGKPVFYSLAELRCWLNGVVP